MTNPVISHAGTRRWYKGHTNKFHRIDGPAVRYTDGWVEWWVDGNLYKTNESYQCATGISDEDMTIMTLKYGNVRGMDLLA